MPSTIRVHRVLRAPPDRVYRAFLDPDAMAEVWEGYVRGDRRWHRPFALYAACKWAESLPSRAASADHDLVATR